MRLRGLLVLSLLASLSGVPASAQIGVSPAYLEMTLSGGSASGALRVFNFGTKPVPVRVAVYNWTLDEGNQVVILPPDEQSLDQWLILSPLAFTVESQGSQVVRLVARPRVAPAPGEHRAIVYFEQAEPTDVQRGDSTFEVGFRFGVAVYLNVPPIDRRGVLHGVTVDGGRVRFDIESLGNVHVRLQGQFAVWRPEAFPGTDFTVQLEAVDTGSDGFPEGVVAAGHLPSFPVLPGTRRTVELTLPELEPGEYILDLNGRLADRTVDRSVAFTVAPMPTPAAPTTPAPTAAATPTPTAKPRPPR